MAAAGVWCCLCASVGHAKELWERSWIEVVSPSFIVLSELEEAPTRELVIELERFRHAVEMLTNIGRVEVSIPTKLFIVSRREKDFGLTREFGGLFFGQMRANFAVVAISRSPVDRDTIVKHEYVHFLLHNASDQLYPPWFDEGFAEFLSTLTVDGGLVSFGQPTGLRVDWLATTKWMPYRKVIEVRDIAALGQSQLGMFYAQSWLLVHYLNFSGAVPDLARRQREYLELSERGAAPVDAFERGFGLEVDRLRAELHAYARKMEYHQLRPKAPFPEPTLRVRALPLADAAAALGSFVLLNGEDHEAAAPYFDASLAADPDHCDALVGRADVLKLSGRFDEAQPHYERAIALHPDDAEHELDFGEFYLDRARAEADRVRREALLVEARRHFARSYRIDPKNPETLAMNGLSYLSEGGDPTKAVASLETAHALLPGQPDIRFLLAQAYVAAEQPALARPHLETLLAWSNTAAAEQVRALLSSLDGS
jgi:tetratricopeptide (TPR) repeat protein